MALQQQLKPALPLIPLLPGLAFLPLALVLLRDLHGGGWTLVVEMLRSVIQPSLDPVLISGLVQGAQVTLLTALLAWCLSGLVGMVLGIICSDTFWSVLGGPTRVAAVIRLPLALIRSIHELIWGLVLLQLLGLSVWVAGLAIAIPYSATMARLVRDLIDTQPSPPWRALISSGAPALSAVLTGIAPSMAPELVQHMGQRLDCALRSAVMLGVFGLGGLGTDLLLSLQSLRFEEVSSGLWMLAALMVIVETATRQMRNLLGALPGLLVAGLPISLLWAHQLALDLSWPRWTPLPVTPSMTSMVDAITDAHWPELIGATMAITAWASAIAIAGPPLLLVLWPSQLGRRVQQFGWRLCRICPIPLAALLMLLLVKPSLAVAAAALGIHHAGVTGRLLLDAVDQRHDPAQAGLLASGSDRRTAALYGPMAHLSRTYLAVGAQRSEIILRDTAVVGLVGGAGLGWELMEALSSFYWELVIALLISYALVTMTGELITDHWQRIWACQADSSTG